MGQLRNLQRLYRGDLQSLVFKAPFIDDQEHFDRMDVRWYLAKTPRHLPLIIKSNYEGDIVFGKRDDGMDAVIVSLSSLDTDILEEDVYYYELEASEDDMIVTREVGFMRVII